jgi:hypothetical protein
MFRGPPEPVAQGGQRLITLGAGHIELPHPM